MEERLLNGEPIEACLLDYVEGRLPAEAVQAVETFLAGNADWAAQVALLRESTAVVSDDCTCPPALKARLLRPKAGRVRKIRRTYYAAAAVVGLLLVAGIVRHTVERPAEESPAEWRLVYSEWVRRYERQKIRKEVRREIRASLQVEDKDMQIIIL